MTKISQESIELVKSVALVDLAIALGLQTKRVGKQIFIPCPNPNHVESSIDHCAIETRKNLFKCFHCDDVAGNNAITMYSWFKFGKRDGTFKQSILGVAEVLGLQIKDVNGNLMKEGTTDYVASIGIQKEPELPAQEPRILHAVYSAFLSLCPLRKEHYEELRNERNYSDGEIRLHQFRSVPTMEEWSKILAVLKQKGYPLDRVPGFSQVFHPVEYSLFPKELGEPGEFQDETGTVSQGHWMYMPNAAKGYFIPVYDQNGFITRLRVRKDEGKPKYVWFSSSHNVNVEKKLRYVRRNGVSSGAPLAIAVPPQQLLNWRQNHYGEDIQSIIPMHTLLVTEGEHKSYISAKFFGIPTIGLPGAGNFELLLPLLKHWNVKKLIVAYDMDTLQREDDSLKAQKKQANLFQIVRNFTNEVAALGVNTCIWSWNIHDGKGLDDLVLNRKLPIEFNLRTGTQRGVSMQTIHDI